jgi:hypothetical protein
MNVGWKEEEPGENVPRKRRERMNRGTIERMNG